MSEILREIGVVARALAGISNVEFKEIHLNKGQYLYLSRIYENPGIINDTLSELIRVERSAVAKSVKKLVEDGLVTKEVDTANKKIRKLFVTEKGKVVYDYLQREEKHSEANALAGLSQEEVGSLLCLLNKVSENVTKDWEYVMKGNKRTY
ncbi:MarR family winged helix-turn-helix transcriptional regulator [Culicoidibacter larvae]|uniref:MarR family transcriptional regulator n=1 Tax=Culicoidibacter larvae TaxID=2579976 RepID=A0A5R8QC35_9FIRM|nr:MarR family transcriptional regulator [Culicoidibacter larvae]TLG72888.1 MarR family transcriptional regulator [Culicoidibacter larvae]